jgi:3-hydroxymyristoyl/3-hydroxydecanoyl-(acyl carrier protein) dehydratase
MNLPAEDITGLIPQKAPFVMVGSLIGVTEKTARSRFIINADSVFIKNNIFQEAGLMENIAQTAALRAGYIAVAENKPVSLGYIGAVKDLEIFSLPQAGDEIETEITIEEQVFNMAIISGKVWLNGELIASCKLNVFTEDK